MGFSPLAAKLLIGSKNVIAHRGAKMARTYSYHHAKYGGVMGRVPVVDEKV